MKESYEALVASVAASRQVLSTLRVGASRYYFLSAMAGYLWNSIGAAETLAAVVRNGAGEGAGPIKRLLHESLLDVLFLSSDPDSELLAAKTILSDYRDSLALLRNYRMVMELHPDADLPPVPPAWEYFDRPVPEMLRVLDEEGRLVGSAGDLFTQAWRSWESQSHWHWSGQSRAKMVEILVSRGKVSGSDALLAMSLAKMYNSAAHPAPAWSELLLPVGEPCGVVPNPSNSRDLLQLALAGKQFLDGITREVRDAFELTNII